MAIRTIREQDGEARPRLTSEQVWLAVTRASFAVLSHITPAGEPRSSGVVYKVLGRRLVVAVAPGSWKAQHVAADSRVAVTVPVRRGGILSLVAPIPPATISFHGTAVVLAAGSPRRASACVIEIIPAGAFRTYGLGVSLRAMLNPAAAQARIPVTPDQHIH